MPDHSNAHPRRASLSLNITVVGGNISGVATAYALQKAGHQVTVLEKSDGETWSRIGLRSPPNMTRILNQWGLGPAISEFGHRCTQFVFHNGESGEVIGIIKLHEQFLRDLMADFVFIQHGDLHKLLHNLATVEGVKFRYNSKVTHVDSEAVSVTLENGERVASDIIVGADGFSSIVRTSVIGMPVPEERERILALYFTVPTDLLMKDERGERWWADTNWVIWLGDGYLAHGSVINSGQDFSMMLSYWLSRDMPEFNEEWTDTYPLEHFNLDLQKFEPRLRKLVQLTKEFRPHVYISRPQLESFVCDGAKLVLVGEAAHPQIPGGHYSASLGLEDAQILGSLFSGIHERSQVPQMLAAYEELRQTRCITTYNWEKAKRRMLTLPKGKEQEERDLRLRLAMGYTEWEQMDEKIFRSIWGGEMGLYAYDASDEVEDWWTKWGPLLARENPNRRSLAPSLQVSVSKNV